MYYLIAAKSENEYTGMSLISYIFYFISNIEQSGTNFNVVKKLIFILIMNLKNFLNLVGYEKNVGFNWPVKNFSLSVFIYLFNNYLWITECGTYC